MAQAYLVTYVDSCRHDVCTHAVSYLRGKCRLESPSVESSSVVAVLG